MLPKKVSALAIGIINALNNVGVFGATYVIGAIRSATGSFTYAMIPIALLTLSACATALWLGRQKQGRAASLQSWTTS
ncbi:hypothetical protein [Bosea sp. Root381]|uniref:hypothetical protein n=1 Tax=Bosea sp. Root381 TaxID=1736524 RepID=UPI0012E3CC99|nr:hypothetical protein [Bosea sp. Root381]